MNNNLKIKRGRTKNGSQYLKVYVSNFEDVAFTTQDGKKVLILLVFNDIVEPRDIKLVTPQQAQKSQQEQVPEQKEDDLPF